MSPAAFDAAEGRVASSAVGVSVRRPCSETVTETIYRRVTRHASPYSDRPGGGARLSRVRRPIYLSQRSNDRLCSAPRFSTPADCRNQRPVTRVVSR